MEGGKQKLLYALVAGLVLCAIIAFFAGRNYPKTGMVDKAVQERVKGIDAVKDSQIKDLQERVDVLTKDLQTSKQRYSKIVNQIKEAARKESEIKAPTTNDEIKNRLDSMGYRTR